MHPEDQHYTKTHEWVRIDDKLATVGITDYAQEELGDIVSIELPAVGDLVVAGGPFGAVDSVKAVSDILSPVGGEVVEVNEDLADAPELVNEDPYVSGWMIIVRMDDPTDTVDLLTSDEYELFVEPE